MPRRIVSPAAGVLLFLATSAAWAADPASLPATQPTSVRGTIDAVTVYRGQALDSVDR
jgi:hypothetical protein